MITKLRFTKIKISLYPDFCLAIEFLVSQVGKRLSEDRRKTRKQGLLDVRNAGPVAEKVRHSKLPSVLR